MNAVIEGNDDLVQSLIDGGAPLDATEENGWTALHFAADRRPFGIAERLVAACASVQIRDKYGNTPLWRAVFTSRGNSHLVRLLLEKGAPAKEPNDSGVSPLDLAKTIGDATLVQVLE